MNDRPTSSPEAGAPPAAKPARRGRLRRVALAGAVVLAAGLAGAAVGNAFGGSGFGPGMWHGHGFMGQGFMGHGFMGGRGMMGGSNIDERADRMVQHLAVELDATDEQRARLRTIVKQAVGDLVPMREQAAAARREARELLTAPSIDRAAIEAFRARHLALAETTSRRLAQALGDAAEVLTPEQRSRVAEHLAEREHRRGWRHDRMPR